MSIHRAWIRPDAIRSLLAAYADAGGREPCGVLLGRTDGVSVRIREAPALPNAHPEPSRFFRLAPSDLLRVAKAARERGLTVVGFWHGHLVGPAEPGEADLEGLASVESLGPASRLLVVAGRGGGKAPVVRAWVREQDAAREIPLAS